MAPFSIRQSLARHPAMLLWALVSVMAGLLVLVAWLEYRWAKQETAATEVRIGTHIESVLVDWHWDFYRQFSAICVGLQVGPDSGAYDDWDAFRNRYLRLRAGKEYPSLVREAYLWQTSGRGTPRLLRMDASSAMPQPAPVSPELEPLLERLASRSTNLHTALLAWRPGDGSPNAGEPASSYSPLSGWQFDSTLPALVHPIVHHGVPGDAAGSPRCGAVDWIVVLLDFPTIRDQILPALTQRYFEHGLYGPLDVTVASGTSPPQILYTSTPRDRKPDERDADAVMKIFGPPPQATEGHLWEAVKNANSIQPQEWHSILGPVWFPVISYNPQQTGWTLLVRSRTGRLDDVIGRVRRENRIVSLAVLLLLAANMSLIGISSYRSNRFAQLQMDFMASISHELRTPLAALLSAGENLRDGVVQDEKRLNRYGRIITTQAQQLIGLVDQILTFASTRSGNRKYRNTAFSARSVVEAVLRANDALLQKEGFTLVTRIPNPLPRVAGDPEAARQCLQNLLLNAMKYSGASRLIEIEAERSVAHGKRFVGISVQDQGVGIAPSEIGQIFKPFYRAPSVQAAQIHGTGLGLAVARQIAEDLGGSLRVESHLHHGSRFTLLLPEAPVDDAEAAEAPSRSCHEREHSAH